MIALSFLFRFGSEIILVSVVDTQNHNGFINRKLFDGDERTLIINLCT